MARALASLQREVRLLDRRDRSACGRSARSPRSVLRIASRFLPTLRSVTSQLNSSLNVTTPTDCSSVMHVDRRLRRRLAQLHRRPGHAPRLVEHDDERDLRLVLALERHGRQPLELGLAVARRPLGALAEHRLAAGDEQAAAVAARPTSRARSSPASGIADARHVAQDHDVPRLERRGRRRQRRRAAARSRRSRTASARPAGTARSPARPRRTARAAAARTTPRARSVLLAASGSPGHRRPPPRARARPAASNVTSSGTAVMPACERHGAGCASTRSPVAQLDERRRRRAGCRSCTVGGHERAGGRCAIGQRRSRRPRCRPGSRGASARRTRGCRRRPAARPPRATSPAVARPSVNSTMRGTWPGAQLGARGVAAPRSRSVPVAIDRRRAAGSPDRARASCAQRRGVVERRRVGAERDDARVRRAAASALSSSIRAAASSIARLDDAVRDVDQVDDRLPRRAGRDDRPRERQRERGEQQRPDDACSSRCRGLKFVRAEPRAPARPAARASSSQSAPGAVQVMRHRHTVIRRCHVHHSTATSTNAAPRAVQPPRPARGRRPSPAPRAPRSSVVRVRFETSRVADVHARPTLRDPPASTT